MPWLGYIGAMTAAIGLTVSVLFGWAELPSWAAVSLLGLALLALVGALYNYKRIT
jgi:hypothetical protein